jgi:WD40 repeat protein
MNTILSIIAFQEMNTKRPGPRPMPAPPHTVTHRVIDPALVDVNNLLVTSQDGLSEVRVWDSRTYTPVGTLAWERDRAVCAAFTADNSLLATGDTKGRIIIWDLMSWKEVVRCRQSSSVEVLCFPHCSNDSLVSLDRRDNGSILVWDLVTGQRKYGITFNTFTNVENIHITLNDARIVAMELNMVSLWDFSNGSSTGNFLVRERLEYNNYLAVSPVDPDEIAVVLKNGEIMLWDSGAFQQKWTAAIQIPEVIARSVCYSSDGARLYLCTKDNKFVSFDLITKQICIRFQQLKGLQSFVLSTDGLRIATRRAFHTEVLDINSGDAVAKLEYQPGDVTCYSRPGTVVLL